VLFGDASVITERLDHIEATMADMAKAMIFMSEVVGTLASEVRLRNAQHDSLDKRMELMQLCLERLVNDLDLRSGESPVPQVRMPMPNETM
jgi:hypothetical protein